MRRLFCFLLTIFSSASALQAQISYGAWRTLAPMPSSRQEVSTAVFNGRMYVIAGFDINGNSTSTVEVYQPFNNTWFPAGPIPILNNHNNAAVAAGALFTFGGLSNATYLYNPQTDTWSPRAPAHFQHGGSAAVGVINDKIYVAGGTGGAMIGNELEVYDPAMNSWTILPSMNFPRNHTAGGGGHGTIFGGGGGGGA